MQTLVEEKGKDESLKSFTTQAESPHSRNLLRRGFRMGLRAVIWRVGALALIFLVLACHRAEGEVKRPNILFLLADDLGYFDLGAYGNAEIRTPEIDRLAREGLRLTQFYSNGAVCTPTRAALLTGLYPQRFGAQLREGLRPGSESGLPPEVPVLPQLLERAGYRTMHVGKWHVGHARAAFRPLAKGYGAYYGFLHPRHLPDGYRDPFLQRDEQKPQRQSGHLSDLLTAEAADFLRRQKGSRQPFFLSVWFFSPHGPLMPPERWAGRYEATPEGRYRALVSALDESVGTLLKALAQAGLEDDTVVIFMSDNGGDRLTHGDSNGPLRGTKNQLAEGGIRVPLIVRWPGHVPMDSVSDELTLGFDLVPTLTEIAGVDHSGIAFDGRSLVPLLSPDRRSTSPEVTVGDMFWDDREPSARFAVRRQHWKLLSTAGETSLYNLQKDPGESVDLASSHPDLVAEMTSAYRRWLLEVTRIPYSVRRLEDAVRRDDADLVFEAPGGTAVIAAHPLLNPLDGELSFVARICPSPEPERSGSSVVARKGDAWSLLWRPDGHLLLDAGGAHLVSRSPLPRNRCSRVAFSFAHPGKKTPQSTEQGRLHLYIGGVDEGTVETPGAIAVEEDDVLLGRNADGSAPFLGRLEDVSFFSTALTAAELPTQP